MKYNFPTMMYIAEKEGLTSTRQGRLNKAIKELAAAADPNDYLVQKEIFERNDLIPLSADEIEYIEEELNT